VSLYKLSTINAPIDLGRVYIIYSNEYKQPDCLLIEVGPPADVSSCDLLLL